ncbi:MAG: 30S ribosomal protein S9 [Candidatus Omnitrophica bacterium]|nr:30S ribosomal protein S9 [Candidatus Omnitrophota bacterium]
MGDITKYMAVGRRKESVARVQLIPSESSEITVNGRPHEEYFPRETDRIILKQPLHATNSMAKFKVVANLCGGGPTGQAGALRLGIARALVQADAGLHDLLRKQGYLTRDPRAKERKKYGQKGARKRFQWTKR